MRSASFLSALTTLVSSAAAVSVSGSAEGFATGVTGGGDATAVYPTTTDELVSYLGDSSPRVIVLQQTFDFTGTEGTTTGTGCAPWGTASACQLAIDQNSWCENYEADAPSASVTYDNAGSLGITVASDKTIIGDGTTGVIQGKGLRIVSGANNIIIQNIHVTNINPHYVWGGDAITVDDADLIWIDHVKTSLIGRQHIVLGTEASKRVTISNNEIDGAGTWSATCNGEHYWALYLTGSNDMITMKGNYIHDTSGRSPKVGGGTLLHAVNNYWKDNSGHAFEVSEGAHIIAEGNAFENVVAPIEDGATGDIFGATSDTASVCSDYLGRACEANSFTSSGDLTSTSDTSFMSSFEGQTIATADAASAVAASVVANAGIGKL